MPGKTHDLTMRKRISARTLVAFLAFVLGIATVPHRVCERDATPVYEGDAARVDALATSVAAWTDKGIREDQFHTGSRRFDGEWQFGSAMMAAMGFGQVALERPDTRAENIRRMETNIDAMLAASTRRFDRDAWGGEDALESLPGDHGHVAYLGYMGMALGLHRALVPKSRFASVHDGIVSALERRVVASKTGFLETYPNEIYPVDNAAGLAAIALHARATRRESAALARGLDALRDKGIDPETGLLFQSVASEGAMRDGPRGSGTALASYFLAYADEATSAVLYRATREHLFRTVLGFGAVLEHPGGASRGDIDSGPVVFGFGVSATGFAMGAARAHGDPETFRALYATTHLFGAPYERAATKTYATGGPLGDAILFAMTTAPSAKSLAMSRRLVRVRSIAEGSAS